VCRDRKSPHGLPPVSMWLTKIETASPMGSSKKRETQRPNYSPPLPRFEKPPKGSHSSQIWGFTLHGYAGTGVDRDGRCDIFDSMGLTKNPAHPLAWL